MINDFEMSDLEEKSYFISMQVQQSSSGIFISQSKYVGYMIVKFGMKYYKPINTLVIIVHKLMKVDPSPLVNITLFWSLVGSLMYLTTTRPCIIYVVSLVS